MKRFYLFAFIVFWGGIARGQTLGFKINPEADMQQGAPKPYFGMSCGMYYNQKIYKHLGFSTGLEYTQVRVGNNGNFFGLDAFGGSDFFRPRQLRMHSIAIPVDMTLMMNENTSAKCLVYFTIGYAFGEVFEQQSMYTQGYTVNDMSLPSKKMIANTFRMGLETRYDPKPKVNLAFGIQYKYIILPGSFGSINEFNVLGAYIKSGLNFLHKKPATKKSINTR